MNTFDTIYLLIIIFFTVIFALKGLKKIIFSAISMALAGFISVTVGGTIGELLSPTPIESPSQTPEAVEGIVNNGLSYVNKVLPTALGTVVTFVLSFLVIRILFKFVEDKIGTGITARVLDRILGGLVGLVLGVSIVLVFSFFVDLFETGSVNSFILTLRQSKIYNIVELLKIKFK